MDIDESIFEDTQQCDGLSHALGRCKSVQRMIDALNYFMDLSSRGATEGVVIFTDFIKFRYKNYLNDIIHLNDHENELEEIYRSLFTEYRMKKCDLQQCRFSIRHLREAQDDESITNGRISNFYTRCFDSIHYRLFHLFELGLRTMSTNREIEMKSDHNVGDNVKYIDRALSRKRQRMNSIRRKYSSLFEGRTGNCNKFSIHGYAASLVESKRNITYSDRFRDSIADSVDAVAGLNRYLLDHAFDSDAIKEDIGRHPNAQNSNLCALANDSAVTERMRLFVNKRRLHSRGFSTGITWWYWPYFAPNGDDDEKSNNTFTDSQMYIPSGKHLNFKEEILEYPTMTRMEYHCLEIKVKEYLDSSIRVREMKAKLFGWCLHYGISEGSPIGADHLRAICLYCDYTELSAKFSESFRRMDPDEELNAVKDRNTSFWWMSKYLREAVEIYGEDGSNTAGNKYAIRGPFYCGVSFHALVPSFYISLKGPTSTTKALEVSMAFSGDEGITLKMNNNREPGKYTSLLDTRFISNYSYEAENLVFAASEPFELISIQITSTSQDFEPIIRPLQWFDFFLSPNWIQDIFRGRREQREWVNYWWNERDVKVIIDLMDYAESNNPNNVRFPQYVLDIFDHWRFSKKRLVIAPWKFDQPEAEIPSDLLNVIFHSLSNHAIPDDANPTVNLLTQRILDMFPCLEFIEVSDGCNYRFSLPLFIKLLGGLQSIQMGTFKECEVKAMWIPSDFHFHSEFESPFHVTLTKNNCGFTVLEVKMGLHQADQESVEISDGANSLELEIEDVD